MSNMSYCRFENTLRDLRDCQDHVFDSLSESEHRARQRLIKICKDIAEIEDDDLPELESDEEEEEEKNDE